MADLFDTIPKNTVVTIKTTNGGEITAPLDSNYRPTYDATIKSGNHWATIPARRIESIVRAAKPVFRFYFIDEPQYGCTDERSHTAHLLRSYRRNRASYEFRRVGLHCFEVRARGSKATARLEAVQ